jgi:hypothetical protein
MAKIMLKWNEFAGKTEKRIKAVKPVSDKDKIVMEQNMGDTLNTLLGKISDTLGVELPQPIKYTVNESPHDIPIQEETIEPVTKSLPVLNEADLGLIGGDTTTKTSDPLTPLGKNFVTFEELNNHYKVFISRIQQQMSTLGGGGEVNLRYLDDVARETIDDGLFLKYNGTSRKFEFANVNANALIPNTTYVTTSEYTVQDDDYYLGVDYAGPTTIILPVSDTNGRCIVIKDEDGDAETNPITVQGTVDNDAGGFILQINNGSIQLIYRNGWRII